MVTRETALAGLRRVSDLLSDQGIVGEIDIVGKLPISLPDLYPRGTGIQVQKSK